MGSCRPIAGDSISRSRSLSLEIELKIRSATQAYVREKYQCTRWYIGDAGKRVLGVTNLRTKHCEDERGNTLL